MFHYNFSIAYFYAEAYLANYIYFQMWKKLLTLTNTNFVYKGEKYRSSNQNGYEHAYMLLIS